MAEPPARAERTRQHEFDGITEYDNALPRWFTALFAISLAWAPLYIVYNHFWQPRLGAARLQQELAQAAAEQARRGGTRSEAALRSLSRDAARIARGTELYARNSCASCHGADATGLIGPNLRDRYWIHGSNMLQILDVLTKGRLEKGMPRLPLSDEDAVNLTIFLVDLNRQGERPGKAIDPNREKEAPIDY